MKLRIKIFLSILIISLTVLALSSWYLINRNHLNNIAAEQERSINEFDFIKSTLDNGIDFSSASEDSIKLLFSRYAQYYTGRGINLMVYKNNVPFYNEFSYINEASYKSLLTVAAGHKLSQVITKGSRHFLFVSGKPSASDAYVLICARDISNVYHARTKSIYLSCLLAAVLIILLGLLSFLYSRWLTKPIELLHKGADAVSRGDYTIRIPYTKDEFHDLGTAFNQMASAVQSRTSELGDKAKELQIFIDDLSHEMNTPLTSIQGYSEFLSSANATQEQRQIAAAAINSEAKRMKDIYTKLMSITITREYDPEITKVKTKELFDDLISSFKPQLTQQDITVRVNIDVASIPADRILIHMLLSNLIRNSLQALPSGGIIELKAYPSDRKMVLEVSDNGCGIPKDKINDVIRPFFRVDKSRSRRTGGAGLGLSICKSIADKHHGELVIESDEGKGTCVKLILG